jgi:hypothetical protein
MDGEYRWLRDQASRAKAALERSAELADKFGDSAPDMDAAYLHPWAWENGRSYWNTGHYHQAVMQAAIRINAETQAKLGRMDISQVALFNEAFSLDVRSRTRRAFDLGRTTAARPIRTCTAVPTLSPTACTPRFATPACTRRRPPTAVRSNSHLSSWRPSACSLVGSTKRLSRRHEPSRRRCLRAELGKPSPAVAQVRHRSSSS